MKKYILIPLFSLIITTVLFAQETYRVRGFVYNSNNGEASGYADVILRPLNASSTIKTTGRTTNSEGFFNFSSVTKGSYTLEIRSFGYEALHDTIEVGGEPILTLRYQIKKMADVTNFDEVDIVGNDQREKTQIDISVNKLDQKDLERVPSMGAENDIIAAFEITPGVISSGDQGGKLYVRGGTPIQNKILLDGMTIYNPFHSIGFFSVFETELIKSADIYTGGFGSKYGGRISSIMDISYRDGNLTKHSGMVSVSPFMGRLVAEGPIYKKKGSPGSGGSYIISAKHSLLKYASKEIYPYVNDGNGLPFSFTDLYGKFTIKSPGGSKFSIFGFNFNDAVNYTNIASLNWNSFGGGTNFMLVPSSKPMIIKGHLNASKYDINFQEDNNSEPRTSEISGFDLGFDFIYFLKNYSKLTYGLNISGFSTNFYTYNSLKRKIQVKNYNTELSGYIDYSLVKGLWVINPGFRIQTYPGLSEVVPEPRLAVKYNATENLRFSMSGGYYSQNFTAATSDKDIVTLFYGFLSAPTNVPSTFVKPNGEKVDTKNGIQTSWHGIFGIEYDITDNFTASIEGYYKYFPRLANINTNKLYPDTKDFFDVPDIYKKNFIIESGYSYGVDVLLKYSTSRLYVWGVYSYGRSYRWNGFEYYVPVFDRRHNVNLLISYAFLKDKSLTVSARWNFGTGFPFTPTTGYYQGESFDDGVTTDYTTSNPQDFNILLGDFNSKRLPTYHRFDITVKKEFAFKKDLSLVVKGGVTNTYNRQNIFYVNRVTNEKIYQLPILPSLGIEFNF